MVNFILNFLKAYDVERIWLEYLQLGLILVFAKVVSYNELRYFLKLGILVLKIVSTIFENVRKLGNIDFL